MGFESVQPKTKTVSHWPWFSVFPFPHFWILIFPYITFHCHHKVQEVVFWILPAGRKCQAGGHLSAPAPPAVRRNTLDTIERNTLDTIERNMLDTIDKKK